MNLLAQICLFKAGSQTKKYSPQTECYSDNGCNNMIPHYCTVYVCFLSGWRWHPVPFQAVCGNQKPEFSRAGQCAQGCGLKQPPEPGPRWHLCQRRLYQLFSGMPCTKVSVTGRPMKGLYLYDTLKKKMCHLFRAENECDSFKLWFENECAKNECDLQEVRFWQEGGPKCRWLEHLPKEEKLKHVGLLRSGKRAIKGRCNWDLGSNPTQLSSAANRHVLQPMVI